jgi:UDP-glucose 4-epimerase
VEALLLAASKPEAVGGIFNLGGVGQMTLRELAETLVEVTGKGSFRIRAFPVERKKIDIGDFYSDCRLIGAVLGWEPRTTIRQALTKTVAYYRKELAHYL